MASAIDIQIVSTPNLARIENYLNNSTYRETIEYSANFNTRLCIERRLRLPFIDPQTGVAQNHCSLYMHRRQRMPGFKQGQLYSYPAARWRKSRRQYLNKLLRPFGSLHRESISSSNAVNKPVLNLNKSPTVLEANNPISSKMLEESSSFCVDDINSDSKDSQSLKDEIPKEWFYDDIDINEMESLDEPKSPADDEYDYDPRYGSKKRKKRRPGRKSSCTTSNENPRKGRPTSSSVGGSGFLATSGINRSGRGRRKNVNISKGVNPSIMLADPPSFPMVAASVDVYGNSDSSIDIRSSSKFII